MIGTIEMRPPKCVTNLMFQYELPFSSSMIDVDLRLDNFFGRGILVVSSKCDLVTHRNLRSNEKDCDLTVKPALSTCEHVLFYYDCSKCVTQFLPVVNSSTKSRRSYSGILAKSYWRGIQPVCTNDRLLLEQYSLSHIYWKRIKVSLVEASSAVSTSNRSSTQEDKQRQAQYACDVREDIHINKYSKVGITDIARYLYG